jgi:DNA-binding NarL/FixJ family response regulator
MVVDSHAIYRRGLVASLELLDRVDRVDQADGVRDVMEHAALQDADVVILDTSIAGGRDFIVSLAAAGHTHVIACTSQCDERAVLNAVEAGAAGYLRKDTLTQEVLQAAIQAVEGGAAVVALDVLGVMLRRSSPAPEADAARFAVSRLTEREQRVLGLIAEGYPTREVAEQLSYSERTVKNVLHDIVTKLNVRSRSQAVAHAVRDGLI